MRKMQEALPGGCHILWSGAQVIFEERETETDGFIGYSQKIRDRGIQIRRLFSENTKSRNADS